MKKSADKQAREWIARVAVRVRDLRVGKGFTLEVASIAAGMHWRHWQKIEACEGNATLKTLFKMAKGLGVKPATLLEV
jgi:transcriptional regulator with XRE-family HTH domain